MNNHLIKKLYYKYCYVELVSSSDCFIEDGIKGFILGKCSLFHKPGSEEFGYYLDFEEYLVNYKELLYFINENIKKCW